MTTRFCRLIYINITYKVGVMDFYQAFSFALKFEVLYKN
jgi:hypothetical protein